MSATKLPCYYISHGGPPLLQEDQMGHQWFKQWGKSIIEEIKPKAIVVISAHWETANVISVTSFPETNPIIYDFYGFPKIYYQQTYDSKGSPELSKRIVNLLTQAGFKSELDHKRGFDHGCWVPMKVAIPEPGDLPIIQVSLTKKASYEHHIKVGQALASLRNEGILIIGSGSLVHNLRETFSIYSLDSDDVAPYVEPFETDVEKFCTKFSGEERDQKLIDLISHPLLRKAHPTDDHLVPLHIAAGAAGNDQGTKLYTGHMAALSMSAIGFGVAN